MPRSELIHRTLALCLLLATSGATSASAEPVDRCDLPVPLTASFLLSLDQIPRAEPFDGSEACFWEVVEGGLPLVPEVLELIPEATITRHLVPLFGGSYAVGDIATAALMKIINVPLLELVIRLDPEASRECGFCAYWRFVRADPENRVVLRDGLREWFDENASNLVWRPNSYMPPGGIWELPAEP